VEILLSDPSRARDVLGWTPQVDLEEGLQRTADWITGNVDLATAHRYHR
jgi:UDP-glucose 4-epimerase